MNGLIVWFARNRVAGNLLMGVIVLSGLFVMITKVPIESSPQFERNELFVKFSYPGGRIGMERISHYINRGF